MLSWLTSDPGREELLCILQHPSFPSSGPSVLGLQDVAVGMDPHVNLVQVFPGQKSHCGGGVVGHEPPPASQNLCLIKKRS